MPSPDEGLASLLLYNLANDASTHASACGDQEASLSKHPYVQASTSSNLNLKCGTVGKILVCNRLKREQRGLLLVLSAWGISLLVRVSSPGFISNASQKMMAVQPNEQTKGSCHFPLETGRKKKIKILPPSLRTNPKCQQFASFEGCCGLKLTLAQLQQPG